MSYNSEISLLNYVSKYICYTFYSEISKAFQILCSDIKYSLTRNLSFFATTKSGRGFVGDKLTRKVAFRLSV